MVKLERLRQEKLADPSANLIDSQTVKIAPFIPNDKGLDGGKKINGRKRHIITDTLGLIVGVIVTAANIHDGAAGSTLFNFIVTYFLIIYYSFQSENRCDKTYLEKQRGRITDKVMFQYTELLRKNLPIVLDEMISERLIPKSKQNVDEANDYEENKIVTTEEEIEAYYIVKAICRQKVEAQRIVFRDAQSYFAIILDDNRLKTICRVYLNASKKYIGIFDVNKKEVKYEITCVDDIFRFSELLFAVLKIYEKVRHFVRKHF